MFRYSNPWVEEAVKCITNTGFIYSILVHIACCNHPNLHYAAPFLGGFISNYVLLGFTLLLKSHS